MSLGRDSGEDPLGRRVLFFLLDYYFKNTGWIVFLFSSGSPTINIINKIRRFCMKKLIVTGIITLLSMMTFAALTYGQSGGPGPGHAMPGAHDKDGPGMGHGKMEGCCMGGHGMMGGPRHDGDHGMMGGRMMEAEHHLARLLHSGRSSGSGGRLAESVLRISPSSG